MNTIESKEAREWLAAHKIPGMRRGATIGHCKIQYSGALTDLDHIQDGDDNGTGNPRRGSDVYSRGQHYQIVTVDVRLSTVTGAPVMPQKQWLRYSPLMAIGNEQ